MERQKLQRIAVTAASSIVAVLMALAICGIILLITGRSATNVFHTMWRAAGERRRTHRRSHAP